jgi:hypothetical protein
MPTVLSGSFHIYIYIYIYIYICMYVCMYVYIYECMYLWVRAHKGRVVVVSLSLCLFLSLSLALSLCVYSLGMCKYKGKKITLNVISQKPLTLLFERGSLVLWNIFFLNWIFCLFTFLFY